MSADLRVAIAGYGLAGEVFHAPLVTATPGLELVAVTTSDAGRAARARAAYPGIAVDADADVLLRRRAADIDVLVVATPNRLHVPIARRALTHRLAVVMDKPLAPDLAPAQALVDDFAAAGVPFTVFQNRRWDGDFLTVRRVVESGVLGTPARFESRYERFRPQVSEDAWREQPGAGEGGGLLLDLGAHLIDQALMLFGPVHRIYAEIDARRPGALIDDDVFLALDHAVGVRSHLWMSAIAPLGERSMSLSGTRGAIHTPGLDPQEDQLAAGLRPGDEGWGAGEPAFVVDTEGDEHTVDVEPGAYEHFYAGVRDTLRDGAPPPVDPRDSLAGLRVIEAARRSARTAAVIDLTTSEEDAP